MASFDRTVLPGGEGEITIKIRTANYSGSHRWGMRVETNDPQSSQIYLRIRAFVLSPIYLSSSRVNLFVMEGDTTTREIEIRAELERPLTLERGAFNLEGKVAYRIEETEKGRRFKVRFTNLPGPPGSFRGFLRLDSNYPEKREVVIWINGRITKKPQ